MKKITRVKKMYQGMRPYRYKDNPLEKEFALQWQHENDRPSNSDSLISWLLTNDNNSAIISDRDRLVAATIIQWLGTPCGKYFLSEILLTKAGQAFLKENYYFPEKKKDDNE